MSDKATVLTNLRNLVIAARVSGDQTSGTYVLDALVGTPLTVVAPAPALGSAWIVDYVAVTGTSSLITGDPATYAEVMFSVKDDLTIESKVSITPPATRQIIDLFPSLAATDLANLTLDTFSFTITGITLGSDGKRTATSADAATSGQATLGLLAPLSGTVTIGGPITVRGDGRPAFSWTSPGLSDFSFSGYQLRPATLSDGVVTVATWPPFQPAGVIPGVNNVDLKVTGHSSLGDCVLSLPTKQRSPLTLTVTLAPNATKPLHFLGNVGLPTALTDVVDTPNGPLVITFFADGQGPTRTAVSGHDQSGTQTWPITIDLVASNVSLQAWVERASGQPDVVQADAGGTITLGSEVVRLSASWTGGPRLWMLTLGPLSAAALAGPAGIGPARLLAASGPVPGLSNPTGIGTADIAVDLTTTPPTVLTIQMRTQGSGPLPVIPSTSPGALDALSLTNVAATVVISKPGPAADVTSTVSGVLTVGRVDIELTATPPAGTAPWTFRGTMAAHARLPLITVAKQLGFLAPDDAFAHGLPAGVPLRPASAVAVPNTGALSITGNAADWTIPFQPADLVVRSLTGSVEVAGTGSPTEVQLTGLTDVLGVTVSLTLPFSRSDVPVVLIGRVASPSAVDVSTLPTVTTTSVTPTPGTPGTPGTPAASAPTWAAPVPANGPAPTGAQANLVTRPVFSAVDVRFDLPGSRYLFTGSTDLGQVFVLCGSKGSWAVMARLTNPTLASVVAALEPVDHLVSLTSVTLIVGDLRAWPVAQATVGGLADEVIKALGGTDLAAQTSLKLLSPDQHPLQHGAYITGLVNVTPGSLLAPLTGLGLTTAVKLYALIDLSDSDQTEFGAELPDLNLLTIGTTSVVQLTGCVLSYHPAGHRTFQVAGALTLTVLGTPLTFVTSMDIDDQGYRASATSTRSVSAPFGLAVSITGLAISLRHVRQTTATTYTLKGNVALGTAKATASLDFSGNTSPARLSVVLTDPFSLGQLVTALGGSWPAEFVDLSFSNCFFAYYDKTNDDAAGSLAALAVTDGSATRNVTLEEGLTVYARGQIDNAFAFDGTLTVTPDETTGTYDGVEAHLQLTQPIDLLYISFAGPTITSGEYALGPELTISPARKAAGATPAIARAMSFSTGVNFLKAAASTATISIRQTRQGQITTRVISGKFDTASVPIFKDTSFAFEHRRSSNGTSKFTITQWPRVTINENLIDFIAELQKVKGSSGCGALVDLAKSELDKMLTSTFTLDPTASTDDAGNLVVSFTGTYKLRLLDDDFYTSALPSFTVTLPATITWDALPQALKDGIAAAGAAFAKDLASHPDKVAVLAGVLIAPQAAAFAFKLVCQRLVGTGVQTAINVAAALFLLGGATLASITARVTKSLIDFPEHPTDPDVVDAPALTSLSWASGTVTAIWSAVAGGDGYRFELLDGATTLAAVDAGLALTASVTSAATAGGSTGDLIGRVRASGPDPKGATGARLTSTWTQLTVPRWPAPPAPVIGYGSEQLTVTWPGSGRIQVVDPSGVTLIDSDSDGAVSVLLSDPVAGTYTAQLQATKPGEQPSTWSPQARLDIVTLPKPATVRCGLVAQNVPNSGEVGPSSVAVYAYWPDDGTHDVRLLSVAGTSYDEVGWAYGVTAKFATLTRADGQPFASGDVYQVELRAAAAGHVSPWQRAGSAPLGLPDVVQITSAYGDDGAIQLDWSPSTAPGATYTGTAGAPGASGTSAAFNAGTSTQISMSYFVGTSTTLTAQVRVSMLVQGGTVIGDWSSPATLTMLTAPAGLDVDLTDIALLIAWRDVASATAYDAQISVAGAVSAAAQPTSAAWSVPRTSLPADQPLDLTVRATALPNRSLATELHFQIVTAKIAGVTASYDWNRQTMSVNWQAAANASSYQLTVDGPAGRQASRTMVTTTSALLLFTAVAGASYTVRVRAVYAIPGVWSDPVHCVAVQT